MKQIIFPFEIFESIRDTIGTFPAETGGILGGDLASNIITHFHFDRNGRCDATEYEPDTETLNKVLAKWNRIMIRDRGHPHSHPAGLNSPSEGDRIYAAKILAANPELPELFVPIIQPKRDGHTFQIFGYVATRNGSGVQFDSVPIYLQPPALTKMKTRKRQPMHRIRTCVDCFLAAKRKAWERRFLQRVIKAYAIDALQRWHVMAVGIGGAAAIYEDMVRAGISKFSLIDPGFVEPCNLGTQGFFRADIGRPKVQCLAERLRNVNKYIEIVECCAYLDDIDDQCFAQLAWKPFVFSAPPENVLIIGATDDFFAQSRINRLALNLGLPAVTCQMYEEGLGGEVMFIQPRTRACLRCIGSSRVQGYLDGYRNTVGSSGSPITSTTRLNALTGTIALAIMHHETDHPRWGHLLERIGDRNLVQVRCHPDTGEKLSLLNFKEAFQGVSSGQIFFDEAIWRLQKPEHPNAGYDRPCPDCGGTGDLAACKGTFADTRLFPI